VVSSYISSSRIPIPILASLLTSLPLRLSLLTGRAVVRLGVGGEWSIGHAMVAESVPPQFKGRASALLQTGEPMGVVMAALCKFWVEGGREGTRKEGKEDVSCSSCLQTTKDSSLDLVAVSHRPPPLLILVGYLAMPCIGWRWCMGLLAFAALLAMATRRSLHLLNTKATDHM